ncbi:hypothetical protein [Candidatus Macondimonas diazotrophica]|jgi:hypothetical protein|uniref:Lipoprotein n=1 Tax=Candidatus Macondimonas diazotrophica TaxID=2305248 RepID=A0A4Z0F8L6_9GAMM|nr:hypothetical protein [Candidatus Macondimonas diazotrophica]TFZ81615.1 hypothetical protein E4680_11575 [Candidatus Macondimonas diazotrophica]
MKKYITSVLCAATLCACAPSEPEGPSAETYAQLYSTIEYRESLYLMSCDPELLMGPGAELPTDVEQECKRELDEINALRRGLDLPPSVLK